MTQSIITRKHFVAVAAQIRAQMDLYRVVLDHPADHDAQVQAQGAVGALEDATKGLAEVFAHFNANFDRERFMTACGF